MTQQNIFGVLTGIVLLLVVMLLIGANSYENVLRRERELVVMLDLERDAKVELVEKYAESQAGACADSAKAWDRFLEMEAAKLECEDRVTRMSYVCDKPVPPPAFGKAATPVPSPPAKAGATVWAQ